MTFVLAMLASAAVVFVVAAVVVGREAHRLDAQPPSPTFDLDEAVVWVAQRLPEDVTAVLSYDEVRRILDWHLEDLRERGLSVNGKVPLTIVPVIVGERDSVRFVMARAAEEGVDVNAEHVLAVLEAQLGYLAAIGAVGPIASLDADNSGAD